MSEANIAPNRAPNWAIQIQNLVRNYGKTEAVHDLSLTVAPGRCYGLFGRNGAGKSTTIKCLLNHLRPTGGSVRVFGMDPRKSETEVKSRIGYVPEVVAFYPWMTVRQTLDYAASFRPHWNRNLEKDLLRRFEMDETKKVTALSKGMKSQVGLLCAICPEPDLLLLDEPTSGLDPIVRREFIETVIGAYQEGAPDRRTVFVSTHLIHEFEGLIDEFTVIDRGRAVVSLESDSARQRWRKIRLRFSAELPEIQSALKAEEIFKITRQGLEFELLTQAFSDDLAARLQSLAPETLQIESLTLEEIFIAIGKSRGLAE